MALPRAIRLNTSVLIDQVQRKGVLWKTPFFRIRYLPNKTFQKQSKYCIIISKKVESSAVERNRIRRKVSDLISRSTICSPLPGALVVIFPYPNIVHASFESLQKTLDFSLQKIFTSLSSFHEHKKHRKNNSIKRYYHKYSSRNQKK